MPTYQVVEKPDGSKRLAFALCDCKQFTQTVGNAKHTAQKVLDDLAAVSLVTDPQFSLPSAVPNFDTVTAFTAQAESRLQYTTIAKYYLTIPQLGIEKQVFATGEISFTVPNTVEPGTVLEVSVQAEDSRGNKSLAVTHTTTVGTAQVLAPSIVIPADGAEVDVQSGVVSVQSSAFAIAGDFSDTHALSDWQLASNASMTAIVQQALNSSDLVAHNFTGLSLDNGATYYLRARHKGAQSGWGSFGSISTFKAKAMIVADSGRGLYRHSSDMGTVLCFNDGAEREVLILDAQYRANRRFGMYHQDSSLTNYTSGYRYLNTSTNSITTTTAARVITDSWINSNICKDANTAKQNCDVWMTYNNVTTSITSGSTTVTMTGVPAVAYCRSISVNGTPCDLSNVQTLARIYCDAEMLDAMDPSKDTHSKYLLGSRNPQGAWYIGVAGSGGGTNATSWADISYAWSSTEWDQASAWRVGYHGDVSYNGKCFEFAVVPVLEL